MCDTLRNTRSRGRSGVPLIRFRWRSEIRFRRSLTVLIFINQLPASRFPLPATSSSPPWPCWELGAGSWKLFRSGLSSLLLQDLTRITDALLLVGIGLAQRPHVGPHLPAQLPVAPRH